MAKELGLLDRKILYYLNNDCRLPNSKIAKLCGTSKQVVGSKISSFMKQGILTKFITIYDNEKLGVSFYNIYLEVDHSRPGSKKAIKKICNLKYTCWVVKSFGKWNLVVSILAEGNRDFRKKLGELFSILGSYVLDHETCTVVDAHFSPYKILFKDLKIEYDFYGYVGSTKKTSTDEMDYVIMKGLSQDARATTTSIAKKLGKNPSIINYRIKNLVKSGIITKFTTLMDLVPLGMRWYYTLLKVKQMNESAEKDLIKHIKNIPGIFYLIRGVGNYDLCFETHCRSPKELEAILHELHASFGATIKKVDNVEILEEYKCDFFPYLMKVTNV